MKRLTLPALAVGLVIALAGCSGAPAADKPTPKPTASVAGLPEGVVGATDVPTDVPNDVASRKNVTVDSCAAADGGWAAKGKATNPGDADLTYVVTVFFTTASSTVLATGETEVTVPAGKSADWEIASKFTAPEGTKCVLRGAAPKS